MAHWLFLLGYLIMAAVCAAALLFGDRCVRLTAVAVIVAWCASTVVQDRRHINDPQLGIALVDAAFLLAVIVLTVIYRRFWLIALGGFHMLGLATHFTYFLDRRIANNSYLTADYFWSYLVLAALGFGAWSSWRRRSARRQAATEAPTQL